MRRLLGLALVAAAVGSCGEHDPTPRSQPRLRTDVVALLSVLPSRHERVPPVVRPVPLSDQPAEQARLLARRLPRYSR